MLPRSLKRSEPTGAAGAGPDPGGPPAGGVGRPVLAVAGAYLVLELAMAARYGFHRDELYFLACSRHLAWGYVDQPPLVPAVARLVTALVGPSVVALRVLPAVAGTATVVLSASMARELGGGRRAQTVAAIAVATSAQMLATGHLLSTAVFDIFFWSAITWLLVRMWCRQEPRLWLAVGAVTGVGLLDKLNVAFLIVAVVAALVVTGRARLLVDRWAAAGAVLALVLAGPDIAWNATHQWAQISMLHSLHAENSTLGASIGFIPAQFIVVGPVLAAVWVPGLKRLARHGAGRPLATAYLVLVVLYTLSGAKPYYLAGMYGVLFAGGGLSWEERIAARPARPAGRSLRRLGIVCLAEAALLAPLTLPVLPEAALARGPWQASINKDLSATVGWDDTVRQLAGVASSLPAHQRARLVILTGDYGAAGAVDLYGPRYGLPRAVSGHNSYWWWGPPSPDDSTTIAVNLPGSTLQRYFARVQLVGYVATAPGVWTEERGDPIWVCTGQTVPWARAWPALRHYG